MTPESVLIIEVSKGSTIYSIQYIVYRCMICILFLLSSGYDFGYLLRLLTNQKLPDEEAEFYNILSCFFPKIYDVKYLMKSCKNLKGGLQEVADQLKVNE